MAGDLISLLAVSTGRTSSDVGGELARRVVELVRRTRQVRSGNAADAEPEPLAVVPSEALVEQMAAVGEGLPYGDQRAIASQVLAEARASVERVRGERLRQARWAFNAALVLAVTGMVIVLVAVALLIMGTTTTGIVAAVVSALTEATAVLLFRGNTSANNRLDQLNADASVLARTSLAMTMIDAIDDPKSRDRAIREAVRALNDQME